jgi:hypothetical protein
MIKHRIGSWMDPNIAPARRCRAERLSPAMIMMMMEAPGSCACLAPDREGHEGLGRCVPWDNTGPLTLAGWQGSAACKFNENCDTIRESTPKRKDAKMAL